MITYEEYLPIILANPSLYVTKDIMKHNYDENACLHDIDCKDCPFNKGPKHCSVTPAIEIKFSTKAAKEYPEIKL